MSYCTPKYKPIYTPEGWDNTYAVYLKNKSSAAGFYQQTPFELWMGRKLKVTAARDVCSHVPHVESDQHIDDTYVSADW